MSIPNAPLTRYRYRRKAEQLQLMIHELVPTPRSPIVLLYLPRYALKSVKYFFHSVDLSSGGSRGPRSALYFLSKTGENETDLGDAERVRTEDAIPLRWGIKAGAAQFRGQSARRRRGCCLDVDGDWLFSQDVGYLGRGRCWVIARSHWELATGCGVATRYSRQVLTSVPSYFVTDREPGSADFINLLTHITGT